MDTIRIMVVEDHQVVREGLRKMLELEPDFKVVAEASSGQEAIEMLSTFSPEIVLMDIKMPGMDGLETTRLITEHSPDCKVIILTLYDEYLPSAVQSGAAGYLLKDLRRDDLIQAVREVRQGRAPLHLSVKREQLSGIVAGAYSPDRLTERELEVLRLVANGSPSREIASQMSLSESTVKRTIRQASEKLGSRNRSEAVAEAMRRNLI